MTFRLLSEYAGTELSFPLRIAGVEKRTYSDLSNNALVNKAPFIGVVEDSFGQKLFVTNVRMPNGHIPDFYVEEGNPIVCFQQDIINEASKRDFSFAVIDQQKLVILGQIDCYSEVSGNAAKLTSIIEDLARKKIDRSKVEHKRAGDENLTPTLKKQPQRNYESIRFPRAEFVVPIFVVVLLSGLVANSLFYRSKDTIGDDYVIAHQESVTDSNAKLQNPDDTKPLQFSSLSAASKCEDWNIRPSHDREAAIRDLVSGFEMNSGKNISSRYLDVYSCITSTFSSPCASGAMTIKEAMAFCMVMLGVGV